jgi:hypothetical protein
MSAASKLDNFVMYADRKTMHPLPRHRPNVNDHSRCAPVAWRVNAVVGASIALLGSSAWAVGANGTKTEAAEQTNQRGSAIVQPMPDRAVEVVVVWGFRFRSTIHPSRNPALTAGYTELIGRNDCTTAVCGFVLVQEGGVWRASNTLAASEQELLTKQREMERSGTVLVIVHPTGTRRQVPSL